MSEGDDLIEDSTGRFLSRTMANPSFVSSVRTTTMMIQTLRETIRTREGVQQEKDTILGELPGQLRQRDQRWQTNQNSIAEYSIT
jgi:hypothetical protein